MIEIPTLISTYSILVIVVMDHNILDKGLLDEITLYHIFLLLSKGHAFKILIYVCLFIINILKRQPNIIKGKTEIFSQFS